MKYTEEERGQHLSDFMPEFLTDYIILALFMKHTSFEEEKEWRMLYNPAKPHSLNIRMTNQMLIPYGTFYLTDSQGKLPIEEIIIGPNTNTISNKHALEILLERNKITCKVETSEIPFRVLK